MELISIILTLITTIGSCICIVLYKKTWNKGYCKECGEKLEYFDTDSQGGKGYKCKNGHYWWIG